MHLRYDTARGRVRAKVRETKIREVVIAKFHYTDPTGPARTFLAARVSEKLRWVRAGLRQSPVGSVRARAVEFSLNLSGA